MIEASFDRTSRSAAIDGAYQYDTGQRLRLSGLPSPDEFAEMEELLSGALVTVQAHYSRMGDSQSEMRLAQWNEDRWCWVAEIPDEYLTRSEPVYVHVYVYYGVEEGATTFATDSEPEMRAHTMYEGVFTPRSRPAPGGTVTDDQLETWAQYEEEIEIVLTAAGTATDNAETQAEAASTAAEAAAEAASEAQTAAAVAEGAASSLGAVDERWESMTIAASTPSTVGNASAAFATETKIQLTLPKGATGAAGATGATGPADITLSYSDGVLTITPT